jgi:hypothetical protein
VSLRRSVLVRGRPPFSMVEGAEAPSLGSGIIQRREYMTSLSIPRGFEFLLKPVKLSGVGFNTSRRAARHEAFLRSG